MEGKRTTTLMVIMCLVILSLTVNSAAECDCCISARAKACCFGCIAAGGSDTICKNTCCFPCILADSVVAKMDEMGVLAKMEEGQA
uniref:Acidic protein n=1 Tax=Oryza barthii TaxID=65489 RepID=A0A0D3HBV3_9ORYZ